MKIVGIRCFEAAVKKNCEPNLMVVYDRLDALLREHTIVVLANIE